ncbi:MAG: helix-turn-helix transcriptional regulator [Sphingomonadales bacterium]|nr:helix-turn-helix transcriptional regulator [Sphingomonadales bacterium]
MLDPANSAALPFSFKVERQHSCVAGEVAVRRYFWARPLAQVVHALNDALVVNMALTSRPPSTRVDAISGADALSGATAERVLVMMPGAPYKLEAPSGSLRSLHCAIPCARFEAVMGGAIDWPALAGQGGELRSDNAIARLMAAIHDELAHDRIGAGLAIEAALNLLCVQLARQFRQPGFERGAGRGGGLANWRMKLVTERVHAERPAPKLAELADLCGLTERQLGRAFKAETGMTLGRYVDEATMERAHVLLTTSRLPIGEIARLLGYASADSFAQAWRRVVGGSPGRARRR